MSPDNPETHITLGVSPLQTLLNPFNHLRKNTFYILTPFINKPGPPSLMNLNLSNPREFLQLKIQILK